MRSRLIYVMDPMCSWCWGFAPVVQALIEQARNKGVGAELVVGGLRQERTAMDAAARELVYDTEPACRALVAARSLDPKSAWDLAGLIQRAFYVEGCDVTLAPELVRLAELAGIPRIEFADRFDSQAVRDATAADFDWARNLGIAGFPTLLAEHDGQLALVTNGYQPLESLSPLLERWLEHNAHA